MRHLRCDTPAFRPRNPRTAARAAAAASGALLLTAAAAAQSWPQTLPVAEVETSVDNPVVATNTVLAVGHPRRDVYLQGSVLDQVNVYELLGGSWVEVAVLISPQPTPSAGSFGTTLALEGDLLAVGDPGAPDPGGSMGAVHLYRRNGGGAWALEASVRPQSSGASGRGFGQALDLSGGRLAVGAPSSSLSAGSVVNGSVYVFDEGPSGWSEVQRLDGPTTSSFASFGWSLDLDGPDRLLVGQPDTLGIARAVLFGYVYPAATFVELHAFVSSQPGFVDGFGRAVALDGARAAVGAPDADSGGYADGLVHVFENLGGWTEVAQLTNPTLLDFDRFGHQLAFEGGSLFAASRASASVLRFDRGPGGWLEAERYVTAAGLVWPVVMEQGFASNGSQVVLSDPEGATVFEREVAAELEVACPGDPHPLSASELPVLLDVRGELSLSQPTLPLLVVSDGSLGQGVLFYGFGATEKPFGGTTLCVQGPLARVLSSAGPPAGALLTLDVDLQSKPIAGGSKPIAPGVDAYFQYWFRVPGTGSTSLSNSLRMVFAP